MNGMTTEEYRQRMMQAFNNANCEELFTVCVLPTEKEFKHLEWLLKKYYKKEPCEDAISRQAVDELSKELVHTTRDKADFLCNFWEKLQELPPVKPTRKKGKWIDIMVGDMPAQACDQCNTFYPLAYTGGGHKYCPNCGSFMMGSEEE